MNNWRTVEFGSVLDGGTRTGIYKKKEFRGSGIKMVNMGELFAYPRLKDVPMSRIQLTDEEIERFSLQVGDLIFARRSLVAEGAGKCSIVWEVKEPLTFESSIIRARPNKEIADSAFLYYLFNSPIGSYLLGTILRQVAVAGITGSDLIKLEIPLPPLPEQRAIAGVLGALDDKIELSRRMNRTLESMARAVFRQWFVESEEVGNWEEKTLEDVTVKITKGTTPTTLGQRFTESGINFVKVNSITDDHKFIPESFDFIDEETHALLSRSIIEKDDVLLTIAGTIGRIAKVPDYILPANTNQAVAIIRPDKSQVLPNYIRMWLCLDDVRQELFANVVHAVQANLSLGMISKTKIRLPEYSRLVKLFEPIELLLQKIEANTKESRTLASLRDSLLPKLMKGEVRVKVSEL